jgi:hypothetical protein
MKKLLILSMMITSFEALADTKRLVCEEIKTFDGTYSTRMKFEVILDTDDCKKELPKAEVTLLDWSDSLNSEKDEYSIGMTYRLSYEVTPSVITIQMRKYSNDDRNIKKDISRKDLTFKNGKCAMEDYAVDNAI